MTTTFWPRRANVLERQLAVIRRLMRYAEVLAEHLRQAGIQHEREFIFDTLSDAETLLRQLGGSAHR